MNKHLHDEIDAATIDEVKLHLPEYVAANLTRSHGESYVCPFCGSGNKESKTGAFRVNMRKVTPKGMPGPNGRLWRCFACKKSGDIFTLIMELEHMTYYEALVYGVDLYARGALSRPATNRSKPEPPKPALTREQIKSNADRFEAALRDSEGERYLMSRGIDRTAQMRFHLGYDAQKRAIVIPFNPEKTYYTERRIDPNSKHGRHSNISGVEVPLYNPGALRSGEPLIFVTEAAIDAISIMCAGGTAIAISGTDPAKLIKRLKGSDPEFKLLLCMDNDDAGRKATKEAVAALEDIGIEADDVTAQIMTSVYDRVERIERKDPNEVLQHDGIEVLRNRIQCCLDDVRAAYPHLS